MKLDLEKTTKGRMESHIKRQTDVIESLQRDLEDVALKEKTGQEEQKKGRQDPQDNTSKAKRAGRDYPTKQKSQILVATADLNEMSI